tara:strand:- start:2065 stop:2214 length:150 start_codon:yes stop_codon:yes gene_type:complete
MTLGSKLASGLRTIALKACEHLWFRRKKNTVGGAEAHTLVMIKELGFKV